MRVKKKKSTESINQCERSEQTSEASSRASRARFARERSEKSSWGVWGGAVSPPRGVWGAAPENFAFYTLKHPRIAYSGTIFTLLKHQIDLAWHYSKQKDIMVS